nr:non-specific lipid-transfer protein 2-like [Tanacetum cinerariifolium]
MASLLRLPSQILLPPPFCCTSSTQSIHKPCISSTFPKHQHKHYLQLSTRTNNNISLVVSAAANEDTKSVAVESTENDVQKDDEDEDDEYEDPDPQDLEYVAQIKRVLELLKKNRDMLFNEIGLAAVMLVVDDTFDFALVGYTKEPNTDLVGKGAEGCYKLFFGWGGGSAGVEVHKPVNQFRFRFGQPKPVSVNKLVETSLEETGFGFKPVWVSVLVEPVTPAPTMVCFVVALSVAAMVFIGEIPGATAVTCNYLELVPCSGAITSSQAPSGACCGKIREQRPCLCGYLRNPSLRSLVSPAAAQRIASQCGVSVPQC